MKWNETNRNKEWCLLLNNWFGLLDWMIECNANPQIMNTKVTKDVAQIDILSVVSHHSMTPQRTSSWHKPFPALSTVVIPLSFRPEGWWCQLTGLTSNIKFSKVGPCMSCVSHTVFVLETMCSSWNQQHYYFLSTRHKWLLICRSLNTRTKFLEE